MHASVPLITSQHTTRAKTMDQIWLAFFAILLPIFFFIIFKKSNIILSQTRRCHKNLPPSPPSFPIIGHLHLLKNPIAHRTFQQLSLQYGSIFSLKLGFQPFVIVSSPAAVEECLTKNDIILANRPRVIVGKHLHYEWTTLGSAPYGPLWLNLRRLSNQELFSNTRMSSLAGIRVEEIRSLVKGLFQSSKEKFVKVEMGSKFSGLSLNILTRILTGKRYYFFDGEINGDRNHHEAKKILGLMREIFELNGISSSVDFLPFLRWFNFKNNTERRMIEAKHKMDYFLNDLIEEFRRSKSGCETNESVAMLHKLLTLQELEPANYSDQIIKGIIMIMLIAGTDTSAVTMEWALSVLLNHPNVLERAREEIDNYKGYNELVEEVDLPKLPYIQCIINETLRLFPAAPLLVGHTASEDITICGYHIAKGETITINAWAIHRDPGLWKDPLSFRPERFQEMKSEEYKYSWIPFGLGRRSCPGNALANKVIGLTLATLIQCFDWERVGEESVDLSEGIGLTMPKAQPLEAMCRARTNMVSVLSNM